MASRYLSAAPQETWLHIRLLLQWEEVLEPTERLGAAAAEGGGLHGHNTWQAAPVRMGPGFLPPTVNVKLSSAATQGEAAWPGPWGCSVHITHRAGKLPLLTQRASALLWALLLGTCHATLVSFIAEFEKFTPLRSPRCRVPDPCPPRGLAAGWHSVSKRGGTAPSPALRPVLSLPAVPLPPLLKAGLWHRGKTKILHAIFFLSLADPLEIAAVFSQLQKLLEAVQRLTHS